MNKATEYTIKSRLRVRQHLLGHLGSKCQFCNFDKHPEVCLTPVSQVSGEVIPWKTIVCQSTENVNQLTKKEDLALACQNCLTLAKRGFILLKKKKGGVFQMLRDKGIMPQEVTTPAPGPVKSLIPDALGAMMTEEARKQLEDAIAGLDLEDD